MQFIRTTATLVSKMKREAKEISKATGKPRHETLEEVALKKGYHHWKHVVVCAEKTASNPQPLTK